MGSITILEIADAIEATLGAATGIVKSQSQDELTEGIQDTPLLQVYWAGFEKSAGSNTDRRTFGTPQTPPIRQTLHTFRADVLARQRSHVDLDMAKVAETSEAVDAVLEEQNVFPYFGRSEIKAFRYTCEFVMFQSSDQVLYAGERFTIEITLF